MEKEGYREQAAFSTPILDGILAELRTPQLEVHMAIILREVEDAIGRLKKKAEEGTLTQADIEHELSSLPEIGGIEEGKKQIVRWLQLNVKPYDVKKLPEQ